jgi:quercetin dioxygenase-like cupin family protein
VAEAARGAAAMQLNADFSLPVTVHAARLPWTPSPIAGVERRMLDRIGDEVARATSIVRYAAGSRFSAHTHGGGEEFLVLDGVFEDEHGDYPAGSYVRNPPASRHMPGSTPGCTLFVKLWQFDPADRTPVRLDTGRMAYAAAPGRPGVEVMELFRDGREEVRLERWPPGAEIALAAPGGAELLVLAGGLTAGEERCEVHSWLRLPCGAGLEATPGPKGCTLWVKTGHLRHIAAPPAASGSRLAL